MLLKLRNFDLLRLLLRERHAVHADRHLVAGLWVSGIRLWLWLLLRKGRRLLRGLLLVLLLVALADGLLLSPLLLR